MHKTKTSALGGRMTRTGRSHLKRWRIRRIKQRQLFGKCTEGRHRGPQLLIYIPFLPFSVTPIVTAPHLFKTPAVAKAV